MTRFGWQFMWVLYIFCKQQDIENDELRKKCSFEGLNFEYSNLLDGCMQCLIY